MNKAFKGLVALTAVCGMLLAAGTASAADIKDRVMRLAYANGDGNPQHEGAKIFADLVSKKSGGKMVVKLFPNGVLGKDIQALSAMQGGTIEMTMMYTSLLVGNSKEAGLVQLPFLWGSWKEVATVLDGPVGQKIHASLEPKGIVGLGYYGFGFLNMLSGRKPFVTVDDFKGQKLRVTETPINIQFINDLGGTAVPLAVAELYTALEQRIVDGCAQPMINVNYSKYYEVQKYLSLTRHMYEPQSFLFSKKVWDTLSADEKKVIKDAFEESKGTQWAMAEKLEADSLTIAKAKMAVNEVSAAELAKMRAKVMPMHDKYAKEYSPERYKEMLAEIAKFRSSNK
jgi:TRAP-type transport system periplasmic protein